MTSIALSSFFPRSTAIGRVRYDPASRCLDIWYRGGDPYQHLGVPFRCYEALLAAASAGEFVNREIKPRFDFEPLRLAA